MSTLRYAACAVALCTGMLGYQLDARAHRFTPAVVVVSGNANTVVVTIRAAARMRDVLRVVLPSSCQAEHSSSATVSRGSSAGSDFDALRSTRRRRFRCAAGGIAGELLRVDGLGAANAAALVRVELDGLPKTQVLLDAAAPTLRIAAPTRTLDVARQYLALGVEHILLGLDHLAFVLCLLLLVGSRAPADAGAEPRSSRSTRRQLALTITAFTLGHSITLSVAAIGLLSLPSAPTEALIALSIVLLAREVLVPRPTLARRRPWVVAAAFGLLHGLGFAGALAEIGLPPGAIPLALACFNLGVELGQLAFVAGVLVIARIVVLALARRRHRVVVPAQRALVYGLGALAGLWFVDRAFTVLSISP